MEPKKATDLNPAKNMFAVVQHMNAGYEKFFDSKPKTSGTSAIRSECYSNYRTCGTTSNNNVRNQCAAITNKGIKLEKDSQPASDIGQNVVQQFFPSGVDETKQCQRISNENGCCKYLSVKKEK